MGVLRRFEVQTRAGSAGNHHDVPGPDEAGKGCRGAWFGTSTCVLQSTGSATIFQERGFVLQEGWAAARGTEPAWAVSQVLRLRQRWPDLLKLL